MDHTLANRDPRADEGEEAPGGSRALPFNSVGVNDIEIPLVVGGWEKASGHTQSVVARVDLSIDWEAGTQGAHLSRLVEALMRHEGTADLAGLRGLLGRIRDQHPARWVAIDLRFSYFLERQAPVSHGAAPQGYRSRYRVRLTGDNLELRQSVEVPVMTLCACSKAISDYGAHNQRAYVTVELGHDRIDKAPKIVLEEVVDLVEKSASSPLYPLLKRSDERHVTMQAYDHPVLTEDVARQVLLALKGDVRCDWFRVSVLNEESIHNHAVHAVVYHRNTPEEPRESGIAD